MWRSTIQIRSIGKYKADDVHDGNEESHPNGVT